MLRLTHLKTIFMPLVDIDDEVYPRLRQTARDKGVRLMKLFDAYKMPNPLPKQWPVSLEA